MYDFDGGPALLSLNSSSDSSAKKAETHASAGNNSSTCFFKIVGLSRRAYVQAVRTHHATSFSECTRLRVASLALFHGVVQDGSRDTTVVVRERIISRSRNMVFHCFRRLYAKNKPSPGWCGAPKDEQSTARAQRQEGTESRFGPCSVRGDERGAAEPWRKMRFATRSSSTRR